MVRGCYIPSNTFQLHHYYEISQVHVPLYHCHQCNQNNAPQKKTINIFKTILVSVNLPMPHINIPLISHINNMCEKQKRKRRIKTIATSVTLSHMFVAQVMSMRQLTGTWLLSSPKASPMCRGINAAIWAVFYLVFIWLLMVWINGVFHDSFHTQ